MGTAKRSTGTDFNFRRLRANLSRHPTAMERLSALGIGADLADAIGLGIKEPYVRADGREVQGVVTYPLNACRQRRRYGYVNLEGVTTGGNHPVAWGPGAPETVRSGAGGTVVVLGSPLAVWQLGAAARRLRVELVAMACSQPDRMPVQWEEPAFWAPWDRVILAEGVPGAIAGRIMEVARRPLESAPGIELAPSGAVATPQQRQDMWLEDILESARVLDRRVAVVADAAIEAPGDFAAEPISVHGGFARGYLYHPYTVERRRSDAANGLLHSYETLVLRSDGAILEPMVLRAPAGTPAGRRVHALSDGTRIVAPPQPSRQATWSLSAIQRYAADRAAGADPCGRSSAEILDDVHRFLASRVRLPDDEDLGVVAAFVVMTHMFRIFDALPILMICGPRGSGKSELASAVVALASNATLMGQGSAAALIRLTRECGGLVALDDAEALSTQASSYGELGQCLKLSYKSATARKPVALGSGRVEVIDFFGPRLLTTIRGVDQVLGSRCIRVPTAPAIRGPIPMEQLDAEHLRDELHALAMSRAAEVARAYASCTAASGRRDEIWAPLTAIADVLAGPALRDVVERARRREGEGVITSAV